MTKAEAKAIYECTVRALQKMHGMTTTMTAREWEESPLQPAINEVKRVQDMASVTLDDD